MRMNLHLRLAGILLFIIIAIGCSGGGMSPEYPANDTLGPVVERETGSERMLWGAWDIYFDPVEMKAVVLPAREVYAHYDVTEAVTPPACDDCVVVEVNSFDPVGSASVVTTLDTPDLAVGVFVTSYMAYVADRSGGLRIIRLW